jgi:hypothetical protein
MKKLLFVLAVCCLAVGPRPAFADDNAFFKVGPLSLNIPFKTANVVYMYDFHANQNLVGGETVIATVWNRVEGTVGAVTSLQGQGTPFVGGNILIGNLVDKYITLPPDFKIGGFGGFNFQTNAPIYGLKASIKIWGD